MSRVHVVVSYHHDRSHNPRGGPAEGQRDVYWANIAVQAATLRHVAGSAPAFVVHAGDDPTGDAATVLADAGAEIEQVAFDHRPPDDFYTRYLGSLFLLDTLATLAPAVDDDDVVLLVDPDVVWVRPPGPLVEEVRRGGIVGYELDVPDTLPLCDLTRLQQTELASEMTAAARAGRHDPGPDDAQAMTHFGGELYGMLGAELREVASRCEELWSATIERYRDGRAHFHTEEHVMNAVLWERGEQRGRANPFVQRIRTLPAPMGSRERAHGELVAWHLPIEKDKGFLTVLRHLATGNTMPPPGPEHVRWLERHLGIAPTGARWVADRARQVKWRVTRTEPGPGPTYGL